MPQSRSGGDNDVERPTRTAFDTAGCRCITHYRDKMMRIDFLFGASLLAAAFLPSPTAVAFAADVTVQPASGSGFVVKDASGANERLRVQENGAISVPGLVSAATQAQAVCANATGVLGLCTSGSGGGSYSAGTGLALAGGAFSIAPTWQLPQTCSTNQVVQWNGTAWICAAATAVNLPGGMANQTVRYDGGNALIATGDLQVMSDGGVLATNAAVNTAFAGGATPTGTVPVSGPGARLMWYPAKAAFRAGYVNSTRWDDSNIGTASVALGVETAASGVESTAMGLATYASGRRSTAMGYFATASGDNSIAIGEKTTAGGTSSTAMGSQTKASGDKSTSMGADATASGNWSTAMGYTTTASGDNSTAMGYLTTASGSYSTAMGSLASTAGNSASFVYGDGTAQVNNTSGLQFMVLANGGAVFYTGSSGGTANQANWPGVRLTNGSGSWSSLSDRAAKDEFTSVDTRAILDRVAGLPMTTWHYRSQDKSIRHIGAIAQDFYAAFNVGEDERHISTVDADGVALAAIQGLNDKFIELDAKTSLLLNEKDREIAGLRERIARLETQAGEIATLKSVVAALQRQPAEFDAIVAQP